MLGLSMVPAALSGGGHRASRMMQADGGSGTPRVLPMVVLWQSMLLSWRELPNTSYPELPAASQSQRCLGLVSAPDLDAQLLVAAFHYCVFALGPVFIINRRSSAAALAGSFPFLFLPLPVRETCPNPRRGAQKT